MFCGAVRSRIRLCGRLPVIIVKTLEIILRAADQRSNGAVAHQGDSVFFILCHVKNLLIKVYGYSISAGTGAVV
ncbi:hypothetical protein IMSAGC009_00988 [Lachnospiraceae bacterium]|nr:hypothetical protein IMSAGC009_00988 [Lachnospiraceae bacterium]